MATAENGRLPTGQFGPGNRAAAGNPAARRAYELRRAMQEAASPELLTALTRKLAVMALQDGDLAAARLFLEYTVGRPAQAVELSGPDGEPLGGPDWNRVEDAVLAALKPFGDKARFAVAMAIRGAADAGAEPAGD